MLKKVLFAGGGTGGHIFMAVALAQELGRLSPAVEVQFVDSDRGLGRHILREQGFPVRTIRIGGLKGVGAIRAARTLLQLTGSLISAVGIVRDFRPDLVVGLGGYSSGPVMLAGRLLGVPLLLIEPNVVPGLANRIVGRFADGAAVAFPETARWFGKKARCTGVPVRADFYGVRQPVSRDNPLRILVFGGSQGSRVINRMVCEALPFLPPERFRLVHQAGFSEYEAVKKRYEGSASAHEVLDFVRDMPAYFARADLVICRAGASSIAELTAAGKASVLIPLPTSTDDHQRRNAEVLVRKGAACLIDERETTGKDLADLLAGLEADRDRIQEMARASAELGQPDSRDRIVRFMEELADPDER